MNANNEDTTLEPNSAMTRRSWIGLRLVTTTAIAIVLAAGCDLPEHHDLDSDREEGDCEVVVDSGPMENGQNLCPTLSVYLGEATTIGGGVLNEFEGSYDRLTLPDGKVYWAENVNLGLELKEVIQYDTEKQSYVLALVEGHTGDTPLEKAPKYEIMAVAEDPTKAWGAGELPDFWGKWKWENSVLDEKYDAPLVACGPHLNEGL